jgi:hypothetical protein
MTAWHISCGKMRVGFKAFQLETEIVMRSILSGLAIALATVPAFAAVEVAPAPAVGLGVPAIAAVIVVGLIALLLKHIKV